MAGVTLLNVLDVSRSLGSEPMAATPESVAAWLTREYLPRRGGRFNYDTSIFTLFDLFRGTLTPAQAIHYCETNGIPLGRRHNADAIKLVGPYAASHVSSCFRIGNTAVAVGRISGKTVYIGIKAPLVRVADGKAFVVMPGFRMSYRPTEEEIDVACSVALATFARDDYAIADFEYLYAGPGLVGGRMLRVIQGRDRHVYDRDTVDALLDIYVRGVSIAASMGAELRPPSLRGYRIIDPREPYFV